MKIFIASDLHGEAWSHGYDVPEGLDFDVAVFAGDVHHAYRAVSWLTNQRALWHKPMLFVAGNHEYYGSVLEDAAATIRDKSRGTNVRFLDATDVPVIDGVRFLGCTMWTDYRFDAESQAHGLHGRTVHERPQIHPEFGRAPDARKPFMPADAYKRHVAERRWLTDRLSEEHSGPTVCITHHAPHPGSLHERYGEDEPLQRVVHQRSLRHNLGAPAGALGPRSCPRHARLHGRGDPRRLQSARLCLGAEYCDSFTISSSKCLTGPGLRARARDGAPGA